MPTCNCHGKEVLYRIEYIEEVQTNIVSLKPICSITRQKLYESNTIADKEWK